MSPSAAPQLSTLGWTIHELVVVAVSIEIVVFSCGIIRVYWRAGLGSFPIVLKTPAICAHANEIRCRATLRVNNLYGVAFLLGI